MINRRRFLSIAAGAVVAPHLPKAPPSLIILDEWDDRGGHAITATSWHDMSTALACDFQIPVRYIDGSMLR
jgi:hypothetical protein